ncbi:hypothetical protein BC781_105277 [Sediminitomix flava]|uniref:Uncharacterized protein n=1 Tax=Sediminitomix flava TaxID=379075 RepID=A0A315ZVG6_SEDFL|nr:hypothetical protein BC781_105277 [Sediminitomix flava]
MYDVKKGKKIREMELKLFMHILKNAQNCIQNIIDYL